MRLRTGSAGVCNDEIPVVRRRSTVVLRILAATAGAYLVTYVLVAALAVLIPAARPTATLTASFLFPLIGLAVVVGSFAVRSLALIYVVLLSLTALALALVWLLPWQ